MVASQIKMETDPTSPEGPDAGTTFSCYLPVADQEIRWGLYVTGAGQSLINPGDPYPPPLARPEHCDLTWERGRILPEYQLFYISRGAGEFESVATGLQPVRPGTLFLLLPGVWHRFRPGPCGWIERWAGFDGNYVRRLQSAGFFTPESAVISNCSDAETVLSAFGNILRRVRHGPSAQSGRLISADLLALLGAVSVSRPQAWSDHESTGSTAVPAVRDRLVAEAMRLIWSPQSSLTIDQLADELAVTRRTLSRHFREEFGHGVHESIVNCRLARSKQLLTETEFSLEHIAEAAGFSGVRNFRRAFRAAEGMTPGAYRRRRRSTVAARGDRSLFPHCRPLMERRLHEHRLSQNDPFASQYGLAARPPK